MGICNVSVLPMTVLISVVRSNGCGAARHALCHCATNASLDDHKVGPNAKSVQNRRPRTERGKSYDFRATN